MICANLFVSRGLADSSFKAASACVPHYPGKFSLSFPFSSILALTCFPLLQISSNLIKRSPRVAREMKKGQQSRRSREMDTKPSDGFQDTSPLLDQNDLEAGVDRRGSFDDIHQDHDYLSDSAIGDLRDRGAMVHAMCMPCACHMCASTVCSKLMRTCFHMLLHRHI